MKLWKCSVCGFVFDGEDAPDKCPKCGAPKEKFALLDDTAGGLVTRSRKSNAIHMKLYKTLEKATMLAEQGIEDNLDPTCVVIFKKMQAESWTIKQMIKAELEAHMKKGKWG
jgi:rubredoxin